MMPWPGASVLARATIMWTPDTHVVFSAEAVASPAEFAFPALIEERILMGRLGAAFVRPKPKKRRDVQRMFNTSVGNFALMRE